MNENSRTQRPRDTEAEPPAEETTEAAAADTGGDAEEVRPATFEDLDERLRGALRAASDKKALESVVLDLRRVASFTDFFVITSGTNVRQVQAIADEVVERLRDEGERALRVEGYNAAEWILIDYGDFIVHVFEDNARRFYDLERLWRDASRVELPADLRGASREPEADGRGSLRR
ncbi:MAG TPA: ribosome silencing factor [Pyrinomonadaceae bacterium]|nr:ribosome silencing factor [Pyrinomonadaceae bacterium]